MPILGFTPVCTMAKELAVALASNHLTITENFQAPTFTATEVSWSIIKGQCYIRKVRAESVCLIFHLSWAYVVVRNDIRDPLATMKDLFVSFRFIEPSSDNLRLIIKFENTIFIHKLQRK